MHNSSYSLKSVFCITTVQVSRKELQHWYLFIIKVQIFFPGFGIVFLFFFFFPSKEHRSEYLWGCPIVRDFFSPLVFSSLWPFLCLVFSWAWHLKIIHLVDCLSILVCLTSFQGYSKLLWFLQEYHRNDFFLIGSYHGVNQVHTSYWWFNWCMHINDMHTSYWWFSWMKLGSS